jgi:hypothetical protein
MAKNKGNRLYATSKIPRKNERWPAQPSYKYHDVFPSDPVFKYADLIRKRLGTDSIDLLQFHVWTDEWSDEPDFRRTVEKLKGDGTIRYFDLSLNGWEPENGIKAIRSGLVDTVQVIYSIFDQSPEDDYSPLPGTKKAERKSINGMKKEALNPPSNYLNLRNRSAYDIASTSRIPVFFFTKTSEYRYFSLDNTNTLAVKSPSAVVQNR